MTRVRTRSKGVKPASSEARRGAGVALAACLTAGVLGSGAMPLDPATEAAAQSADQELVARIAASPEPPVAQPMVPAVAVEATPAVTPVADEEGPAAKPEPSPPAQPSPVAAALEPMAVSALTVTGIPDAALRAYRAAAQRLAVSDPQCGLDWSLLAGIGRVESHHGRYGGANLGVDATARPHIIGIALDGRPGVDRITDSDDGHLDGDATFDRAVGPMQFIPGTWAGVAADGDRDGQSSPHDLDDAALAAGAYLCAGQGSLANDVGARRALLRYNNSSPYGHLVLVLASAYRAGTSGALPEVEPAGSSHIVLAAARPPVAAAPPPPTEIPAADPPPLPPLPPVPPVSVAAPPTVVAEEPVLAVAADEEISADEQISDTEISDTETAEQIEASSREPTKQESKTAAAEPDEDATQTESAKRTDGDFETESETSAPAESQEPTDESTEIATSCELAGPEPIATDEPTGDASDEPMDEPTDDATDEPTDGATDCDPATPEPTATDEPTDGPTLSESAEL